MNILRKLILFGWMAIACTAFGKDRNADKVERPNTKKVNFGIKAGFNSSMFMVSELKIKDVTIDEVQNNYKIGYFGALFMRINMKKSSPTMPPYNPFFTALISQFSTDIM